MDIHQREAHPSGCVSSDAPAIATDSYRRHNARSQGCVNIGISGWRYAGWRGDFYPPKLRQRDELSYASRHFATIEINGTHYSLQRPESFARWHDETPSGFVFAVKGSRYITHMKRLDDIAAPLANFFAQGILCLGDKLGPILWQFPPRQRFDAAKFAAFFELLPRDTTAAAALARRHDLRLAGRAWTKPGRRRRLRHAVEVRHVSFLDPTFVHLLRRYNIAFVFADAVDWPYAEDVTADFLYLRLHGSEELYTSGYGEAALARWASRIMAWSRGGQPDDAELIDRKSWPRRRSSRDVYVYFDNDAKVHAPYDAQALRRLVPGRLVPE